MLKTCLKHGKVTEKVEKVKDREQEIQILEVLEAFLVNQISLYILTKTWYS